MPSNISGLPSGVDDGLDSNLNPGSRNVFSDRDLYITTTADHFIYLNYGKTSTDATQGKIIIGKYCNFSDIDLLNGSISIVNGGLSAKLDVSAERNLLIGNDIHGKCIDTSVTNYGIGVTQTLYYDNNTNMVSENSYTFTPYSFIYTTYDCINWTFTSNVGSISTSATNASNYSVAVPIAAESQQQLLTVSLPVWMNTTYRWKAQSSYNSDTETDPDVIIIKPDIIYNPDYQTYNWYSYAKVTAVTYENGDMTPGQWYECSSQDAILKQDTIPLTSRILVQFIPAPSLASTVLYQNSITPADAENPVRSVNTFLGTYNYQVQINNSDSDHTYTLNCGFTTKWTPIPVAFPYPIFGPTVECPMDSLTQTLNLNNYQPVKYTLLEIDGTAPRNPTVGTTMVNNLYYNQLQARYNSGWFAVSPNSSYIIAHNLNMSALNPLNYQITWSTTNTGTFPLEPINMPTVGVEYTTSNTFTITTGSVTAWVMNGGNNQYAGFYRVCFF